MTSHTASNSSSISNSPIKPPIKRAPPLILPTITPHSGTEIALLPLLQPFGIAKPQTSPLVIALINERVAGDLVEEILKLEERLYDDLRKAQSGSNNNGGNNNNGSSGGSGGRGLDGEDKDKNGGSNAMVGSGNGNSNGNTASTFNSSNGNSNSNSKKSKKSKKSKAAKSSSPNGTSPNNSNDANALLLSDLETQISTLSHHLLQARENFSHQSLLARATIQGHYTLVASTLERRTHSKEIDDKEKVAAEEQLERLEAAYEYLSDNDRRDVYIREMVPVMKKVGVISSIHPYYSPAAVVELPYIQMFQCAHQMEPGSSPIVIALLEELHQANVVRELRSRMSRGGGSSKDSKWSHSNDSGVRRLVKEQQDLLHHTSLKATEIIRKHYRKKSIQLHPDRNGESYRHLFEEFTEAKDVLVEVELRMRYLREMMEVYRNFGRGVMKKSHESWCRRHRPDKAEQAPTTASKISKACKSGLKHDKDSGGNGNASSAAGNACTNEPLRLQGGFHHQILKGPMLTHRHEGKSHVTAVSIHALRPLHEFYSKVRSIDIAVSSTLDDGTDDVRSWRVERKDIVKNLKYDPYAGLELPALVDAGEVTLAPGHYEIHYVVSMDVVSADPTNPKNATEEMMDSEGNASNTVKTNESIKATFHVADRAYERKVEQFEKAEESCKIARAELMNVVHKLKTQWDGVDNAKNADNSNNKNNHNSNANNNNNNANDRYGQYHQILVRASKKHRNLHRLMLELSHPTTDAPKPSPIHDSLSELLRQSRLVFSERQRQLDDAARRREKKDKAKMFKSFVASVLESDDPIEWMRSVGEEELQSEGGDTNRLYQLFIEGKGKYVLMVDSDMYKAASLREDLFSPKQCSDLASRGEMVAIQEAKEEEEALAEERRRREEQEQRQILKEKLEREAELRRKWSRVGYTVRIQGLTSEKGKLLNGSVARVVYYNVENDLFEVECEETFEKAYLKEENFKILYAGGVKPNNNGLQSKSTSAGKVIAKESAPRPTTHPPPNQRKVETREVDDAADSSARSAKSTQSSKAHRSNPSNKNFDSLPTRTIYVSSSHSKLLTGKKGKKKHDLVSRSGARIDIGTKPVGSNGSRGSYVPVHLKGDEVAVQRAITLIIEVAGSEHVFLGELCEDEVVDVGGNIDDGAPMSPTPPPPSTLPTCAKDVSPINFTTSSPARSHERSHASKLPTAIDQMPSIPPSGFQLFSGMEHMSFSPTDPIHNPSLVLEPDHETKITSQYSFNDALLPKGLMDGTSTESSQETPSDLPSELPLEIGIKNGVFGCSATARESITDASVSSLNDRSLGSRGSRVTYVSLPQNDPLLSFLRSQHQCIKGSAEDFYVWLVKSEDIDSMDALKEAVADDDYVNESLKVGNGSVGLKGFKRKAFQRAVLNYGNDGGTGAAGGTGGNGEAGGNGVMDELSSFSISGFPSLSPNGISGVMNGIGNISIGAVGSNAFLPSNLFGASDDYNHMTKVTGNYPGQGEEAPSELFCPIDLVLMTEDPVLAADGVTYSRSAIEKWFETNIVKINSAKEKLKANPHLQHEQEVVRNGIRSPMYGTQMPNLNLTPNTNIKNMARAYKLRVDEKQKNLGGVMSMNPFLVNGQRNGI